MPRRPALTDAAAQRDARYRALWRWLALGWLLLVIAIGWHQWRFWQQSRIDSDVLAMLPQDADDRQLADATRRIADASARQMVVLLGAAGAAQAQQAQAAYLDALQASALPFEPAGDAQDWFARAQAFYAPHRDRLLTPEQRQRLREEPAAALAESALAALYGPMGAPRLTRWQEDPLGLLPQWWQARAASSGLRVGEDGLLHAEGRVWAVLQFRTRASAFRLDGERTIEDALDRAAQAARAKVADITELRAGVPLHAEAAAVQASREVNLIGLGSLTAVLLLAWLAFRSLRPIALVAMSLLIGCATALSVTAMVFGNVHLLTLIFGASLIGVAEDYGIHWFASRRGKHPDQRWSLLRYLLPGLSLALLTSALAYLALGLAPFPGLRQMALFSVVGLTAAFLTVICWFPWLDGGQLRVSGFSRWLGGSLQRWPRVRASRGWAAVGLAMAVLLAAGLWRLQADDDLRSLQSSPQKLVEQQGEIGRLLGMPSPAQFFLVRGPDSEAVLQREEALLQRLAPAVAAGQLRGYRAISDWLPSKAAQQADAELTARVEVAVMAEVGAALGEPLQRAAFSAQPLTLQDWLASPVSQPFRQQWLGALGRDVASVVMLDGLQGDASMQAMQAVAAGLPGVRWVDRTGDFSRLLAHYRVQMSWLLLAGVAAVFVALWWRYRGLAWRALAPTVLAGLLTVALLGLLGQPLQLFNVLALLLLLGMGIDYGIFLVEHRGDASAWLAVCVGAASTWLSFGLLALSATPALRAFGLTLLFGIGLVWLISPLFRPPGPLLTHAADKTE
ncbi:MMPL family transporter [Pseudoxanthomonas wuyuanensis]